MANTNCEHIYQGPYGVLTNVSKKTTTETTKNREEELVGVEGEHRDIGDEVGEKNKYASATRIDAIKEKENSNGEIARALEKNIKEKEGN